MCPLSCGHVPGPTYGYGQGLLTVRACTWTYLWLRLGPVLGPTYGYGQGLLTVRACTWTYLWLRLGPVPGPTYPHEPHSRVEVDKRFRMCAFDLLILYPSIRLTVYP